MIADRHIEAIPVEAPFDQYWTSCLVHTLENDKRVIELRGGCMGSFIIPEERYRLSVECKKILTGSEYLDELATRQTVN